MRRTRTALLTGCLVVAGIAGAGTASGEQRAHDPDRPQEVEAPVVIEPLDPGPELPGPELLGPGIPGPRMVEPDRRPPGAMPEAVPRRPGAVPMPELDGPRSRPVPMPHLDGQDDGLVIPRDRLLLRGGSQSPGD